MKDRKSKDCRNQFANREIKENPKANMADKMEPSMGDAGKDALTKGYTDVGSAERGMMEKLNIPGAGNYE